MMDDVYIRMCREAKEIQELRPESSYFPPVKDGEVVSGISGDRWLSFDTSMEQYRILIWLPRQEDLQQIVLNKCRDLHWSTWHLLWHFNAWFKDFLDLTSAYCLGYDPNQDYDLNQLWLCYLMEEFYKKYWNGTTWTGIQ